MQGVIAEGPRWASEYLQEPLPSVPPPSLQINKTNDTKFQRERQAHQRENEVRQLMKKRAEIVEKKNDLAMLQSYNPWGKPGAGAPNLDSPRYQGLSHEMPTQQPKERTFIVEQPQVQPPPIANLPADPIKATPVPGYDQLIELQSIREEQRKIEAMKEDIRKQMEINHQVQLEKPQQLPEERWNVSVNNSLNDQPFAKDDVSNQEKSHQWYAAANYRSGNDRDTFDRVMRDGLSSNDPYVPSTLDTDKRKKKSWFYDPDFNQPTLEKTPREQFPLPDDLKHRLHNGYGINVGGVQMMHDKAQHVAPRHTSLRLNEFGEAVVQVDHTQGEGYHPWGRAGAGAPRRDKDGRLMANIAGALKEVERPSTPISGNQEVKRRQQNVYLKDLQEGMINRQYQKEMDKEYLNAPAEDIAAILHHGQVGKPRRDPQTGLLSQQHLGTTDVTRYTEKNPATSYYHAMPPTEIRQSALTLREDLSKAAEDRHMHNLIEKERMKEEAQMHYATFPTYFGRPGYGAPREDTTRLHNSLQDSPRFMKNDNSDWSANKIFLDEEAKRTSPAIRSTIPSNNHNFYDLDERNSQKLNSKVRNYKINTPYALDR